MFLFLECILTIAIDMRPFLPRENTECSQTSTMHNKLKLPQSYEHRWIFNDVQFNKSAIPQL